MWRLLLLAAALARAEDTPPGLVSKDSDHDLVAEASNQAPEAQKREASLSNSYGEPLPSDAYGPPVADFQHPAPVYGPPPQQNFQTPPGAYGPPTPVFPSQVYQGPPPPIWGKPRHGPPKTYGPPKPVYGPPKQVYGPPKKLYGPPKQSLPKPVYGAPFKPKLSFPKTFYGPPKPVYGPPKPVYGPPKPTYGAPLNIPIPLDVSTVSVHQNFGISNNLDLGLNLPAPIYGTPLPSLPADLRPAFPIPADTYGPPGHSLGPIGPNDQVVVDGGSSVHYGPPQPDPNPRPPHPGIPAPPTPPHVLYDGWKPIPGVSKPIIEEHHHHQHLEIDEGQFNPPPPPPQDVHINFDGHGHSHDHGFSGAQINTGYSSVHQDALANIDLNAIVGGDSNHIDQSKTVFEAHYTEGASGHDHSGLDIQSLGSGLGKPSDSYGVPLELSSGPYPGSVRQHGAKGLVPPSGVYGVPPGSQYGAPPRAPPANLPIPYGSISGGGHSGGISPRHPIKFRESVPDGLLQQVGQITHHKDHHHQSHLTQGPAYLPPPIRDAHQELGNHGVNSLSLAIEPSSLFSLPHSGNPITFQQGQPSSLYGNPVDSYSVPLFTVDHTGSASNVNEVKATLDGTILANLSNEEAAAILKHCPYHEAILKAAQQGDKISSELASRYVASLSSLGTTFHKNHETLMSPQNGFNTPVQGSDAVSYNSKDLASASHTLVETIVPANDIKSDKTEKNNLVKGKSIKDNNGNSKNHLKDDSKEFKIQYVSDQIQKTSERIKNLSEETKQLQQKIVSTSQNLNQFSLQGNGGTQFKGTSENLNQFSGNNGQGNGEFERPVKGKFGSYSLQIQSADGTNGKTPPSIPHEHLLSEGLLHSILQAIEQPPHGKHGPNVQISSGSSVNFANQNTNFANQNANFANQNANFANQNANFASSNANFGHNNNFASQNSNFGSQNSNFGNQNTNFGKHVNFGNGNFKHNKVNQQNNMDLGNLDAGGLVLPAGYEPVDHTKEKKTQDQEIQSSNQDIKTILQQEMYHSKHNHKHRGDIPECDLRPDNSVTHTIVMGNDNTSIDKVHPVTEVDENDVAIYFDDKEDVDKNDKSDMVTEISVATSISENVDRYNEKFGEKIKKA